MARVLQVVEREDVLHLSLGVDDRARAILHARLNLLAEELLHIVWLLVSKQGSQILWSKSNTRVKMMCKDSLKH